MTNLTHIIFDSCSDAVLGINVFGVIQYWNENFKKLLGYSNNEIESKDFFQLLRCKDRVGSSIDEINCPLIRNVIYGSKSKNISIIVRDSSSKEIVLSAGYCYLPSTDENDTSIYFVMRRSDTQQIDMSSCSGFCRSVSSCEYNSLSSLSNREATILALASNGLSTLQIAENLNISLQTVRNHFKKIYVKLHVHSRSEAVIKALRTGLSQYSDF